MTTSALQTRFEFERGSAAKFAEFHATNPQVYEILRRFALEAKRAGRERIGIRMLWERMRWYTSVETQGDPFKLNDHYHAYYARLLMEQEPELAGFFETRRSQADD